MDHAYEIEIKSLLGSKDQAEALVAAMGQKDPNLQVLGTHRQLNHYFSGTSLERLVIALQTYLNDEQKKQLDHILEHVKDFSVRTRDADGKVLFVLKASIDDTTSSNGTARLEFEAAMPLSLGELDKLILEAGFEYQAKWSRERQEFKYKDVTVDLDKNAGYGYLAEFELVVGDPTQADSGKEQLRQLMADLGVSELPQDRLARMFDYYNANWPDYYGTDKIFVIE
jgi:adenylate cyclase class IV